MTCVKSPNDLYLLVEKIEGMTLLWGEVKELWEANGTRGREGLSQSRRYFYFLKRGKCWVVNFMEFRMSRV